MTDRDDHRVHVPKQSTVSSGPSDDTVIVPHPPVPWYQKLKKSIQENKKTWTIAFIGLFIVFNVFLTRELKYRQSLRIIAGTNQIALSLQPTSETIPPEVTLQLWATADNPVAFVHIELSFDPARMKLTQEVVFTDTRLTRVAARTSMSQANTSGKIVFALGLDPAYRQSPPTGTFQLAKITIAPNTSDMNVATVVSFSQSALKVVNPDGSLFTVTATGSSVTLNPLATPTPSLTPTPTSVLTPTSTAAATPTPEASDTTPPVVTITEPKDGENLSSKGTGTVTVQASDASGIELIEIFLDQNKIDSCSNTLSCSNKFNTGKLSSGTHTISSKATDKSPNHNTATATITVNK